MLIFFGPYSPPDTGQSLAFRKVVDHCDDDYVLVDTTKYGSRFINNLHSILSLLMLFINSKGVKSAYFTCTRSFLGSLKDVIFLRFCKMNGIRVVNHLHGADFRSFYEKIPDWYQLILKKAYRTIDTSIVLTKGMESEFSEFPEMKKIVVNNFYPAEFDHMDSATIPKAGLTISYFSHLMFSKGIFDFLESVKIVKSNHPKVAIQIAGEFMSDDQMSKTEVERRFFQFLAYNQSLGITYIGKINTSEKFHFLSISDILVLPTFYKSEGIPLVIIEAMRCANSIITTDHNYLHKFVTNKSGVLVETRNIAGLAESMVDLIDNPDKLENIQQFNSNTARTEFTESRYLKAINLLLDHT